jgi:glycosyltransferase involved in cell wall biosynthesis
MVSIVIINYNDKKRINRAIESALNQTYKDIEVIMVDDGSDKETRDIYKKYPVKLIQLEREDKSLRTPSRARNAGIKEAKGEYICFLDSDNYYKEDFVEKMISDNDVSYCDWKITGLIEYTAKIKEQWSEDKSLLENYVHQTHLDHQCLMIKKELLDFVGFYDERLPRSQDCDMIVRLIKASEDWRHVPEVLFVFEKHEKDQQKNIASFHGKTLWYMKHSLNINILFDRCKKNPVMLFAVIQGVKDFMNSKEWKEDRKNSTYNKSFKMMNEYLKKEVSE